ncbi:aspartic proteinase Asp1-like [Tripterygium wilfordii]|uniref:aspartic proteinase Asp1-like n=1 Tax=Tripterygium wilfordii TaxID=458696 RepID=UPI0018F82264|nr:aspartic proteinase Asp1-like [Tripterygium wilfordii]
MGIWTLVKSLTCVHYRARQKFGSGSSEPDSPIQCRSFDTLLACIHLSLSLPPIARTPGLSNKSKSFHAEKFRWILEAKKLLLYTYTVSTVCIHIAQTQSLKLTRLHRSMEGKTPSPVPPMMMMAVLLYMIFQSYFSKALGAFSFVFPVHQNVHTGRAYFTNIDIGSPHKSFELHIDSGNDLTWVQCDVSCRDCNLRQGLYKPAQSSFVKCEDPLCTAIHGDDHNCPDPNARCRYLLDDYADLKSTEGYLVKDVFSLQLRDGSVIQYPLVFGCGYKQIGDFKGNGVLGLSRGQVSLLSQMDSEDLIHKETGHCLSSEGGGYLFLGSDLIPSGVSWTPIIDSYKENYLSGPVDLLFDGTETQVKQLEFDFDSGFSLSYLDKPSYEHTLNLINQVLKGTPLTSADPVDDSSICWTHNQQPIRSLNDITHFFPKLTLKFTNGQDINMLELPAKNYIILVGEKVCLGISESEESVMENPNVIGVNFMQDKMVIYSSVHSRIGWTPRSSCDIP